MRHVAIIGSGPAGYYTAEALQKHFGDVRVDIIDRLPVPYGLIRTGVAPDHQSIKGVSRRYEAIALSDNVRFVGNVTVGRDVSIAELLDLYDAVVLATGAPATGRSAFPATICPAWSARRRSSAGITAIPISPISRRRCMARRWWSARAMSRSTSRASSPRPARSSPARTSSAMRSTISTGAHERITILARRGPHQIAMTPKELGELGHLDRAAPEVDPADLPPLDADAALEPGQRKSVTHLRDFAAPHDAKPITIDFDFFAMPVAIEGDGKVERVIVERTAIDAEGRATGTGETYAIPAALVVSCIGYRTPPIDGVPYDAKLGRFANDEGRIGPGLYAVGWARRGPTGTIGTNRPDGFDGRADVADTGSSTSGKARRASSAAREPRRHATFRDWQKIEEAEIANARPGSPREKFVRGDWMDALGR